MSPIYKGIINLLSQAKSNNANAFKIVKISTIDNLLALDANVYNEVMTWLLAI